MMNHSLAELEEANRRKTERVNSELEAAGSGLRYDDYDAHLSHIVGLKERQQLNLYRIPPQLNKFHMSNFNRKNEDPYQMVYNLGCSKSGMIYLCGGEATGKTLLAVGFYNSFADKSQIILADWQRMIDAAGADHGIFNRVCGIPVLVIENFLQSPNDRTSSSEIKLTREIIEARNDARKATLITSQLDLSAIKKRDRTLSSTLREAVKVVYTG
jgi:DNA replication protein DnaC